MWRPSIFLLVLLLFLWLGPLIWQSDPLRTDPANALQLISARHPLGTDHLGRDVLSRVLHGGQRTVLHAASAALLAVTLGTALGLVAARAPRPAADGLSSMIDASLALPPLLLALVVMTVLGRNAFSLVLAVGLSQIPQQARVVRTAALSLQSALYLEAARSMGAGSTWILLRHSLPNLQPILLTYAGIMFSYAILSASALSFLGLGGEPAVPDWGSMLADGRQSFRLAPWVALAPGIAISLTIFMLNRWIDAISQDHRPR